MSTFIQNLEKTVTELTVTGKGMATDESISIITKHFNKINLASTKQIRCNNLELLFSTDSLSDFISDLICWGLYEHFTWKRSVT